MTVTIALAGKGGVGKTTVAGMVIKYLAQNQTGSILAIDADPSSNLNMVLGLDLEWTVGDIREDMLQQVKSSLVQGGAAMGSLPGGMNKRDYLEYHVRSSLAEGSRFDLIAKLNKKLCNFVEVLPLCSGRCRVWLGAFF